MRQARGTRPVLEATQAAHDTPAEDKEHTRAAVKEFAAAYGAKFPKAAAKITDDEDEPLAFFDYPCEHWVHLRTTDENVNPGWWWWWPGSCSAAVA
jgi:transposase-like protein